MRQTYVHKYQKSCQCNGRVTDDIIIHQGVRQGCPLSPALYVSCGEPLARYIEKLSGIRGLYLPR